MDDLPLDVGNSHAVLRKIEHNVLFLGKGLAKVADAVMNTH